MNLTKYKPTNMKKCTVHLGPDKKQCEQQTDGKVTLNQINTPNKCSVNSDSLNRTRCVRVLKPNHKYLDWEYTHAGLCFPIML